MVKFEVKTDLSKVNKMLNKYGTKAVDEYRKAIQNTSIDGLNRIKNNTPSRTGARGLVGGWNWEFKGRLISGIVNNKPYVNYVNDGWNRTRPILPVKKKVLMFEVGKRRAAESSRETLKDRYKAAMKSLKGKGLSQLEKARAATNKSGVVVTRRVDKPASFRGYKFIQKTTKEIDKRFIIEIDKANKRIIS